MNQRLDVKFRPFLIAAAVGMLLSASAAFAQDSTPAATAGATAEATASSDAVPPEVSDTTSGWVLPNADYANTRSATSTINASNVGTLGVAWSVTTPAKASFGAFATNPLVIDGIVYYEDLTSHVFAVKLADGSPVWDKDYKANNIGPNGLAIGYGKVFATVGANAIAALDLKTGEEIWNQKIDVGPTEGIDIQPTVYDGLVYISTVPGVDVSNFYKGNASGIIYALDAITGQVKWSFDTVDSKDIWGNAEVNSGGGAWYPPAIDTATGTTYWSVANPAPWPGTADFPNGSSRPGDNLYSDSLVALDHTSGSLGWYTQVKSHDLFDLDLQLSPILATATISGQQHDIVLASGKLGTVFAIDRNTGDILWKTNVGEHQNDFVQEIPDGKTIKVFPGSLGGVETPMALSSDGIVYVPVLNQANYYTSTGSGDQANAATDTTNPPSGELYAIDVNTGSILWTQTFSSPDYGAATVVNDLVITSTYDGMVYAFNRATGEKVWSWQAPGGLNGFPAVSGDTLLLPVGVGAAPQMVALRLGATGQVATPEATMDMGAMATSEATETPGQPTPSATADASAPTGTAGAGDMSQYITVDAASKTVTLEIDAGLTGANGGINFNGKDHGGATIEVPEGYTVKVNFNNKGLLPHSALVTTPDQTQQATITKTAFDGAETPNPQAGIAPGGSTTFQFVASTQGKYVIVCGIPGHGLAGQWLYFNVIAADGQASFNSSTPTQGASSGV